MNWNGKMIKVWAKYRGIKINDLAKKIGVSRQSMNF